MLIILLTTAKNYCSMLFSSTLNRFVHFFAVLFHVLFFNFGQRFTEFHVIFSYCLAL